VPLTSALVTNCRLFRLSSGHRAACVRSEPFLVSIVVPFFVLFERSGHQRTSEGMLGDLLGLAVASGSRSRVVCMTVALYLYTREISYLRGVHISDQAFPDPDPIQSRVPSCIPTLKGYIHRFDHVLPTFRMLRLPGRLALGSLPSKLAVAVLLFGATGALAARKNSEFCAKDPFVSRLVIIAAVPTERLSNFLPFCRGLFH
jgi:hypothetical protein